MTKNTQIKPHNRPPKPTNFGLNMMMFLLLEKYINKYFNILHISYSSSKILDKVLGSVDLI